jgi:FkbM family methyltransferase
MAGILKRASVRGTLLLRSMVGWKTRQVYLKTGERMSLRNGDPIGLAIQYGEAFEPEVRAAILERCMPGMTVVDVGANIGYYTLLMATRVGPSGRVLAIEPNPSMASEVHQNVQLNQIAQVDILEVALAEYEGEALLYVPRQGLESYGALLSVQAVARPERTLPVRVRRLDNVLSDQGVANVGFLKVDVEGAELGAFKGAEKLLTGANKPIIVFECADSLCGPFGHTCFDVLRYVADRGYRILNINWGNWLALP